MKIIEIRNGWFKAAGNVYGWREKHHVFGVGIQLKYLQENNWIGLIIAGKKYVLSCPDALAFIKEYNSIKTIKSKKIGVVSQSILTELEKAIQAKNQLKPI